MFRPVPSICRAAGVPLGVVPLFSYWFFEGADRLGVFTLPVLRVGTVRVSPMFRHVAGCLRLSKRADGAAACAARASQNSTASFARACPANAYDDNEH